MGIGAKGNEGVAGNVQQTVGSIGYVEYAYAMQNNLSYTRLKNHDGNTRERRPWIRSWLLRHMPIGHMRIIST